MNWFEFSLSGFLAMFIVLNVLNVVIQTVKSIATIKCGAWAAAGINALAYGLYTIVVVYMNADGLGLLWKVEATIRSQGIEPKYDDCIIALKGSGVPFNYIDADKYIIINCYCATQNESLAVKNILNEYGAKYFVSESKTL